MSGSSRSGQRGWKIPDPLALAKAIYPLTEAEAICAFLMVRTTPFQPAQGRDPACHGGSRHSRHLALPRIRVRQNHLLRAQHILSGYPVLLRAAELPTLVPGLEGLQTRTSFSGSARRVRSIPCPALGRLPGSASPHRRGQKRPRTRRRLRNGSASEEKG